MRGLVSALTLAACLCAPSLALAQQTHGEPGDPLERFNRNMFALHQSLDDAVIEPVARGYRALTPGPVREGVMNFLRNLKSPVIFANDMLQGEVSRAGATAGRFAINTTIGIGGIFDPAAPMGLERHDEDFGQTLAAWGVDSGPYIFVPLIGPSNLRDLSGAIVDVAFDPLTWAGFDSAGEARATRGAVTGVATREQLIETIDGLEGAAIDDYVAYRSAYALTRESAIQNGRTDVQDLPDFGSIDELPAMETPISPDEAPSGANEQQQEPIQPPK
jgi:phospholipid-binding lipoprotein MlaA